MKQLLSILAILSSVTFGFSQTKTYPYCNCTETLTESGNYSLNCDDILMEEGHYKNGKRTGSWITRNTEGEIIIKAKYTDDKLDGIYEQYHFKGDLKLKAQFDNGLPDGSWTYYNDKGRIIKEGQYDKGKPVGIWKVYNKKGKKVVAEYDFDNQTLISNKNDRFFKRNGVARDDQSGEWMVLYFPNRNISAEVRPVGGYMLTGDIFIDYINIPYMFMNTYAHYEFLAELKVSNNKIMVKDIVIRDKKERFNETAPSFPFLVQTNPPKKLTRTEHSDASVRLLKGRIRDIVAMSGPWITNGYEGTLDIQIPFVLNDLKR